MSKKIASSFMAANLPSARPTGLLQTRKTSTISHKSCAIDAHLLHFSANIDNARFVCNVYSMQRCTPVLVNPKITHGMSVYRDSLHRTPALDVAELSRERSARSLSQSFAFPMYNSKQEQI